MRSFVRSLRSTIHTYQHNSVKCAGSPATHPRKTVDGVVVVCGGDLADALLRLGRRASQRVVVGDMMRGLHTSISHIDSTRTHSPRAYLVRVVIVS